MRSPALEQRFMARLLAAALVSLVVGAVAVVAVVALVHARNRAEAEQAQKLVDTARLAASAEQITASARGYLLMGEDHSLDRLSTAQATFTARLAELQAASSTDEEQEILAGIRSTERAYRSSIDQAVAERRQGGAAAATRTMGDEAQRLRDSLAGEMQSYRSLEDELWDLVQRTSAERSQRLLTALALSAALAFLIAGLLALLLHRAWRQLSVARDELEENLSRLKDANADLDAFAGRIAHDVRNALGPFSLSLQILSRHRSGEVLDHCLGSMRRVLARTNRLVDGLLEFSRAGRPSDRQQSASLARAIEDSVEQHAPAAEESGIEIVRHAQDVDVACDASLLQVVTDNLLGNAVKFLRAVAGERRVVVSSASEGGWGELVVEDSGPGIPEDEVGRIFEPFFRGANAGQPGMGIGLATVHRIVEGHGGMISVRSQAGGGAIFTVLLPLAPSASRPASPAPAASVGW